MRFKTGTSLESRLVILTIGTLFVLLLALGHFAIREQTQSIIDEKQRSFEAVTRALAVSAEPIVKGDSSIVSEMLSQQIKNANWDMRYVVITDDSGQVVYARSRNSQPPKETFFGQAPWRVVRTILGYDGINASRLYKVEVPFRLAEDKWGTFTAGYSMTRTQSMVNDIQNKIILSFAIAMLLGIVGSIIFARSISRLLQSLTRGAHAVVNGNLSYRVPMTKVADELRHLVDAFNFMIDTISNTQADLVAHTSTDALTGLYNHKHFHDRLDTEFSRTLRHAHQMSLIFLDVDHFGDYNLRNGHVAGDTALSELGMIIRSCFRDIDICARYSSEKFAVVLPETDHQSALTSAERLKQEIEKHQFPVDEKWDHVTVSIGIASAPVHATDKEGLLVAADIALHRAKAEGGDKIVGYKSDAPLYPRVDPVDLYSMLHTGEMESVEALAASIDAKHRFPEGHSRAVAELAAELARKMNLQEVDIRATFLAGMLRDIGQIAVPDEILLKKKALSAKERRIIASHPNLGHSILEKSQHFSLVLPGVLHHHERYDGGGYPAGLAGEDIPMIARILSVADAYESMVTSRPHRKQLTSEQALSEITELAGTQFDPAVVNAFVTILSEKRAPLEAA